MKPNPLTQALDKYLDQCAFRDYDIVDRRHFASSTHPIAHKIAVHQCVNMATLKRDVDNAIHNFSRDGFGSIVFYVWTRGAK